MARTANEVISIPKSMSQKTLPKTKKNPAAEVHADETASASQTMVNENDLANVLVISTSSTTKGGKQAGKGTITKGRQISKVSDATKKKRQNMKYMTGKQIYHLYIHRVLKQVHPECNISSKSMSIMNSLVNDMF